MSIYHQKFQDIEMQVSIYEHDGSMSNMLDIDVTATWGKFENPRRAGFPSITTIAKAIASGLQAALPPHCTIEYAVTTRTRPPHKLVRGQRKR